MTGATGLPVMSGFAAYFCAEWVDPGKRPLRLSWRGSFLIAGGMYVLRSRREVVGHVALVPPSLGQLPVPAEDMEAQRDGVVALFARVAELKATDTGAEGRRFSDYVADGLTGLVLELIGHDLTDRRARLSDAAHFGCMVGLLEPSMRGYDAARSHPLAATALTYVAVQIQDEDKLFEQITVWALQAGYWLTRTGMDADVMLDELRTQLGALLAAVEPSVELTVEPSVPRQRQATHDDVEVDLVEIDFDKAEPAART